MPLQDHSARRIVVSPVSFEPMAALLPVLHLRATHVALVTTVGSELAARTVAAELDRRGIVVTPTEPVIATDALAFQQAMGSAVASVPVGALYVNATPGTKVMALAGSIAASRVGGTVVYADTGDDRMWLYRAGEWTAEPIAAEGLDVGTFVRLSGWQSRQGAQRVSFPRLAKYLGEHAVVLDGLLDPLRGKGLRPVVNRPITPIWEKALTLAASEGLLTHWAARDGRVALTFSSTGAADYLAGGYWLEDYVHGCATDAGFTCVERNVEILRPNGDSHTDLDIAIIHRHRLFVVSCKTGGKIEHREPFDRFVEHIGGLLAGALVISTKHAGAGVAERDDTRARAVKVQAALLNDLPTLKERLTEMVSKVERKVRTQPPA